MAGHGWHVQVQLDASETDVRGLARELPVPLVVDHMGYPRGGCAPSRLRALLDALAAGACLVKLSAPFRISAEPAPHADATALAAACLDAAPERCLWATDWPHTETNLAAEADADWLDTVRCGASRASGRRAGTRCTAPPPASTMGQGRTPGAG